MGKIIRISDFNNVNITKGDKMCRDFLMQIRKKPNGISDMPDRAQDVLSFFKINDLSSGVPIIEILTKLGFKIYQGDLEPKKLSAYIAVDPKFKDAFESNKITCVQAGDNIGHKRFALAHELAHYLFDFREDESLYYYNTYFSEQEDNELEERRANKFAANLLMPENAFRNKYEEYKKLYSKVDIVNELGQYFLVSSKAVLLRFSELGIDGFDSKAEK